MIFIFLFFFIIWILLGLASLEDEMQFIKTIWNIIHKDYTSFLFDRVQLSFFFSLCNIQQA